MADEQKSQAELNREDPVTAPQPEAKDEVPEEEASGKDSE